MENKKIISKVEEPTSWCSGMVVIPKKTGAVTENLRGLETTKQIRQKGNSPVTQSRYHFSSSI